VLKSGKVSPHMHYFIEKMMAKEREIRYQSPTELIADIEQQIRGKKTLEFDPDGGSPALKKPFDGESRDKERPTYRRRPRR
jgi:hypothetical protein